MTYEELLKTVNTNSLVSPAAIIAVVELHKPSEYNANYCSICSDETHDECYAAYPCLTIQAILKELK